MRRQGANSLKQRKRPPTAGSWRKGGPSPNPTGRPKASEAEKEAREAMAHFGPEAVQLLIAHARGEDAKLSLDALKHLTQNIMKLMVELTGRDGGPVQTTRLDLSQLTTAQLAVLEPLLPTGAPVAQDGEP